MKGRRSNERRKCRARNRKNRARRERKREKARAATIDALFMPDGSQAVGDAVCEETAEEKADEVARRQGALHPEQEAMAHSLSGNAGRSDEDPTLDRALSCEGMGGRDVGVRAGSGVPGALGIEPSGSNPRARTLGIELVCACGGVRGTRWMSHSNSRERYGVVANLC